MQEPKRNSSINSLNADFRTKLQKLIARMIELGYDPQIFEAKRTPERQRWLYGVGRTHDLTRKPITWTLKSQHLTGDAADIVSKSKLWNHPKFFARLKAEAPKYGLYTIKQESCHIQNTKP